MTPYERWRKKTAKNFKCSTEGVDAAVEEGKRLYEIMRENDNPLVEIYRQTMQPAFVVFFLISLYAQNEMLKSLMEVDYRAASPEAGARPFGVDG